MSAAPQAFVTQVRVAALLCAVLVLPFCAFVGVAPPDAAQVRGADPLILLVYPTFGGLGVALACLVPAGAWLARRRPDGGALRAALLPAFAGAGLALVTLLALRLLVGATLPGFVPPEESARPGLALGFGAGLLEESVFRVGLLAGLCVALSRRLGFRLAAGLAIAGTALAFAAAHELGPGENAFQPRFFLTRLVLPGALMSALFFRPGPVFLVSLHTAAHLGIAALFDAPGA